MVVYALTGFFTFSSRDQVVDFILKECEERGETNVVLMGNSIGGFTVASVAAALGVLHQEGKSAVRCNGLVLMNSAGLTVEMSAIDIAFQDPFLLLLFFLFFLR